MAALTANSRHIKIVPHNWQGYTVTLFYSYDTVVGVQAHGHSLLLTDEKFSATTRRHIRKFDYEHDGVSVGKDYFKSYVRQVAGAVKTDR